MLTKSNILALDYGQRRVGVAVAHPVARLPHPLTVLEQSPDFWTELAAVLAREEIGMVVVGLPRGMEGQDTAQTAAAQAFAVELRAHCGLPVYLQDEAVTSIQAEAELRARGKTYEKGMIDSLAAVYILEDYLTTDGAAHV